MYYKLEFILDENFEDTIANARLKLEAIERELTEKYNNTSTDVQFINDDDDPRYF